jgi:YD repeat-containing protein
MNRTQRGHDLGEAVRVDYDSSAQLIRIALPREHARAQAHGNILLYRPSAAGMDRKVALSLDENGIQVIETGALPPGLWNIKLLWNAGGQEYFLDRRLEIRS